MSEEINRTITRNADDSFGALPEDAELAFSPQKDYESLNIPEVDGDDVFVRQQRKSDSISSLSSEGSRQSSKSRFRKFSRFNATSPQRNRVDQINSEYRWLQCTDLISGEEFYLNQTTGESFTDLPSKSHRRMESNPERASFVNQSRAHPGISIVSNAASDTELSLNSPQTSALRFVDVLAIIDGMETQLSDILDCLDSKDSSLIFDSNTIEHIRNAKKELHQALENEESLGGSVSDFSDIHSILERSHPLVNYESESARQFRKSVVNNFDLNDLSDVNDVETRRSSVEVTNIFYKKSQELSACKLLMNERLNLYDELLERHDLPIERLLPRYFSTSISFSYKENLVIVCVLFLPNEFFKILENKTVVNMRDSADDVLGKILKNLQNKGLYCSEKPLRPVEDFVLKLRGCDVFFFGDRPMIDYHHIRDSIVFKHRIEIVVEPKKQAIERYVRFYTQDDCWNEMDHYRFKALLPSTDHQSTKTGIYIEDKTQCIEYSEIHSRDVTLCIRDCKYDSLDALNQLSVIRGISSDKIKGLFLTVSFVYGIDSWFESPFISRTFPFSEKVEFDLNLEPVKNSSKVTFENIPREMRILCVLCAELEEKSYPVAWTQIYFINDNGRVNTGVQELILYPISRELARSMKKDKTGVWDMLVLMSHGNATTGGRGSVDPGNGVFGTLSLVMNTFDSPVHRLEPDSELRIISNFWKPDQHKLGPEVPFNRLPKESQQSINQICSKSILFPLTSSEKELIWLARHSLVTKPEALPRFLQTVDWTDFDHKMEAYRLLKLWKFPQSLAEIIELLGAEFPDTIVRGFAVSQLYTFDKFDIRKFIPQLIQALKFELCHWSKLSEFLLIQSISDPFIIGIELLWYLKFEMLRPMHAERFGLLAEAILSLTGPFAWEFCKQHVIVSRLQMIAQMVSSSNERGVPKKEVMKMYKKQMIHFNEQVLNEIGGWRNPLNALFTLSQLNVEKCRYMSSKMAPLWLNIKSSDSHGKNTNIILKVGDDLRQDILVLQMLRAFESCWRSNDLDFQLSPYACLQTGVTQQGRGVGLIEVVGNAETTSRIHWEYGGRFGALQRETLCKYLEQFNGTPQLYESAVDIFTRSCAGYCIATFILGIGDRHNGNIMIKEDGHLFHIDFGHILGNFKSKVGINRERAAFVFTPEMAYIIGRKSKSYRKDANYKRFIQLCLEGYQSLRDKTRQWIAMVRMMLPAGIPELRKRDDITYMLNMLMEGSLPSEAIKRLEAEIDKSVNTKMRVFDNLVHTWVHEG